MAQETNKNGIFVKGAIIGGIVGASAALLMAKKPGRELREDIANGYRKVSGKTYELANDAKNKVQEITRSIMQRTGGTGEQDVDDEKPVPAVPDSIGSGEKSASASDNWEDRKG